MSRVGAWVVLTGLFAAFCLACRAWPLLPVVLAVWFVVGVTVTWLWVLVQQRRTAHARCRTVEVLLNEEIVALARHVAVDAEELRRSNLVVEAYRQAVTLARVSGRPPLDHILDWPEDRP